MSTIQEPGTRMNQEPVSQQDNLETPAQRATQNAERDLLNLLLPSEQVTVRSTDDEAAWSVETIESAKAKVPYPMDPSSSEAWFDDMSSNHLLDSFSADELDARAVQFFNKLDQLWEPDLLAVLSRKFVTVPGELLKAIAAKASQVASVSGDLADQLIACTQDALPQWAEEDLRIFARPLAYAMRGDAPKSEVSGKDWDSMSEIEQAKFTLAIAKYALDHTES